MSAFVHLHCIMNGEIRGLQEEESMVDGVKSRSLLPAVAVVMVPALRASGRGFLEKVIQVALEVGEITFMGLSKCAPHQGPPMGGIPGSLMTLGICSYSNSRRNSENIHPPTPPGTNDPESVTSEVIAVISQCR